jgi:antitoxin component YwqK of YwqJK toxin-antitoxin module
VDDEIEGPFVSYYPNGKMCLKGRYHLGQFDGVVETYNENGIPLQSITYKLGRREGATVTYVKGGKSKEVDYFDGKPYK